jgi:hypothetical protein
MKCVISFTKMLRLYYYRTGMPRVRMVRRYRCVEAQLQFQLISTMLTHLCMCLSSLPMLGRPSPLRVRHQTENTLLTPQSTTWS